MASYSEDQLDLLMESAATVLMAAVTADRTGPVGYLREMMAGGNYLYEARNRYSDNALVQALFERKMDDEIHTVEEGGHEALLNGITLVNEHLEGDEEGREFRTFLYGLAERVVAASRTRWFGPRISETEEAFLAELRSRLGQG
jgi:hypothetical protein